MKVIKQLKHTSNGYIYRICVYSLYLISTYQRPDFSAPSFFYCSGQSIALPATLFFWVDARIALKLVHVYIQSPLHLMVPTVLIRHLSIVLPKRQQSCTNSQWFLAFWLPSEFLTTGVKQFHAIHLISLSLLENQVNSNTVFI